jgi:hypothetical protein
VLLYAQEWNRFEFWAESVNILCRPLNQCWVKAQIDCGDVDVCEVYTVRNSQTPLERCETNRKD